MAEACSNCRFWDVYDGGVYPLTKGDCRRRAPLISDFVLSERLPRNVDTSELEAEDCFYEASAFPVTHNTSWCGEYEPKGDHTW